MSPTLEKEIAARLQAAEHQEQPIDPFAGEIGVSKIAAAYRIQQLNVEKGIEAGRVFRGRKIGLTATAVQAQLGVSEPDYGTLFSDMEIKNGGTLNLSKLIAPRIEAEIAFVMSKDVDRTGLPLVELEDHIEFAISALEVVDSRLKDWRIGIVDTIADNGASSHFVLGDARTPPRDLDLTGCQMALRRNGALVSCGTGAETLGHPLKALRWLAETLIEHGRPLKSGDLVLTGALGPVAELALGDTFEGTIDGLSPVTLQVGQ